MKHTWYKLAIIALTITACGESGGYETAENGMQIKYYTKLNGLKPKVGDEITFRLSAYCLLDSAIDGRKDTLLFSTNRDEEMGGKPVAVQFPELKHKGSLWDGLQMMGKGDSAEFLLNADTFFFNAGGMMPPFVKPGSIMTFRAKLIDVTAKAEFEKRKLKENEQMAKKAEAKIDEHDKATAEYIAKNKLKMDTTASGLKWRYLKKGSGPICKIEDGVEVAYKGYLFDGSVFDQSEKIDVVIGLTRVIRGWDEILTMMKQGDKVQVIIPFWLAYGDQSPSSKIPPYSTLVFDMELKKLIPKKE